METTTLNPDQSEEYELLSRYLTIFEKKYAEFNHTLIAKWVESGLSPSF